MIIGAEGETGGLFLLLYSRRVGRREKDEKIFGVRCKVGRRFCG